VFFSSTLRAAYEPKHIAAAKQLAGQLALTMEKTHLYQQLVELNDLKDRFLGAAAHDLRSPLTSILGFLDLILMGAFGEVPAQQEELLRKVRRSSDGMLRLITDLLDVAAIESGKLDMEMEEADPTAVIQECADSAKVLAQAKAIRMKMDLRPCLPCVLMDPQRIEQVITNLVTNAIKFSDAETTVTLAATSAGNEVRVSVADEGPGIPADEISQLFQDFARTSVRPTGGESSTGLGLAIVKRVVEAHHGSVDVTSREGEGSTFEFSLPVVAPTV